MSNLAQTMSEMAREVKRLELELWLERQKSDLTPSTPRTERVYMCQSAVVKETRQQVPPTKQSRTWPWKMTTLLLAITLGAIMMMWMPRMEGSHQCQAPNMSEKMSHGHGNALGERRNTNPSTHAIPDAMTPPPAIGAFFFSIM